MPKSHLCSFVVELSEMVQGHSGASGIGWWGPGWKLATCGSPRSPAAAGGGGSQQAQASSGSMWIPWLCQWTDSHLLVSQG